MFYFKHPLQLVASMEVGKYLGAGGSVGAWTIKVLSDEINKTGNLGRHQPPRHGRGPCRQIGK